MISALQVSAALLPLLFTTVSLFLKTGIKKDKIFITVSLFVFVFHTIYFWYIYGNKTFDVKDIIFYIINVISFFIEYIIYLLYIYKSKYNGVFAVSLIIFTKDHKFILYKRSVGNGKSEKNENEANRNIWIQPGISIRTSEIRRYKPFLKRSKPNLTDRDLFDREYLALPSELLIREMQNETGLMESEYNFLNINDIDMSNSNDKSIESSKNTISSESTADYLASKYQLSQDSMGTTINNKYFYSPFLLQSEKNTKQVKGSGENVHIDMFYAAITNLSSSEIIKNINTRIKENSQDKVKMNTAGAFTYSEIVKMIKNESCYPDLGLIIDKFILLWRKNIYFKQISSIRYCTFNNLEYGKDRILSIRVTNKCNQGCNYCLLNTREKTSKSVNLNLSQIRKCIEENITSQGLNIKKIIITGGEPFLCDKIYELLRTIIDCFPDLMSMSVCTNGTWFNKKREYNFNQFIDDDKIKEKIAFTINGKFILSKNTINNDTIRFINKCRDKHIKFTVDTTLLESDKNQQEMYIKRWSELHIENIALSYIVHKGYDYRKDSVLPLSKVDCLNWFYELGSGKYEIENFRQIELMIPSCDEKNCNCEIARNAYSIICNEDGCEFSKTCLDYFK